MDNHTKPQRPDRKYRKSNRKSQEKYVSKRDEALDGHDSSYVPFCDRISAPRSRFDLAQSGEAKHTSGLTRKWCTFRVFFFKNLDPDFSVENASDSVSESLAVLGSFHLAQVSAGS